MPFVKAKLTNVSSNKGAESVEVQFNPTEYSIDRGAHFAEIQVPGLRTPILQFVRGEAKTLSLELFLDNTEKDGKTSIAGRLEQLRTFIEINKDLHAPPVCQFEWGRNAESARDNPGGIFQGVVTSFKEKYVLFDSEGNPLRARVSLTLKSYESAEAQYRRLKLESPHTAVRTLREGETLALIAFEEYGDPNLWRFIAEENNIVRPRFVGPGTLLRIPAL